MRTTIFAFIIIIFAALSACHSEKSAKSLFRWQPVTAVYDSLSTSLENAYINAADPAVIDSLTKRIENLTPQNEAAKMQTAYWQARIANRRGHDRRAGALLDSTLAKSDSARNPYEWSRLISIKASLDTLPIDRSHALSLENLAYYEATGDSFMIASTLMRLGAIMWKISDTIPAKSYYLRVDTIFSRLGIERYRIRNLLNVANVLEGESTIAERDSLMNFLIGSPIAKSDREFYPLVLKNTYNNTGNADYLFEAYRLTSRLGHADTEAAYEGEIADYFINGSAPADSVGKYTAMAFAKIDSVSDHLARAMIFNAMGYMSYVRGDYESTVGYYSEFLGERMAMENEKFSLETTKAEYRHQIERESAARTLRESRLRMIAISAVAAIMILMIAVIVALRLKAQRASLARQKAEIELQRNRNHLSACAIDIEEKDRLIQTIVKGVDKLVDAGKIGTDEAREITSSVRQSLSNRLERETFRKLHEKLHPQFMRRLKADFPMLTESQLKHAAFITMGMTSKQIAAALNIEYESVKKSRTRLRQRMGLSVDESLEDRLRLYDAD